MALAIVPPQLFSKSIDSLTEQVCALLRLDIGRRGVFPLFAFLLLPHGYHSHDPLASSDVLIKCDGFLLVTV